MKNGNFDLVHSLTNKADALKVYDRYVQDSSGCGQCQNLWRQIKQDDQRHHDLLLQEINRHAREQKLD
jgi:hypothetical protein